MCERVNPLGEKILQKLNSEIGQHPNVAEVRGKGLLIGIEIVEDKASLKPFDESKKSLAKSCKKDWKWVYFFTLAEQELIET